MTFAPTIFTLAVATLAPAPPTATPPAPVPPVVATAGDLQRLVRAAYGCDRLAFYRGVRVEWRIVAHGTPFEDVDVTYAVGSPFWRGSITNDLLDVGAVSVGYDGRSWSSDAPEADETAVDRTPAPWSFACGPNATPAAPAFGAPVRATFDGRPVDVVTTNVPGASGAPVTLSFDAFTHLLSFESSGTGASNAERFSDYRSIDGIAFSFEQRPLHVPLAPDPGPTGTAPIEIVVRDVTLLRALPDGALRRPVASDFPQPTASPDARPPSPSPSPSPVAPR